MDDHLSLICWIVVREILPPLISIETLVEEEMLKGLNFCGLKSYRTNTAPTCIGSKVCEALYHSLLDISSSYTAACIPGQA